MTAHKHRTLQNDQRRTTKTLELQSNIKNGLRPLILKQWATEKVRNENT